MGLGKTGAVFGAWFGGRGPILSRRIVVGLPGDCREAAALLNLDVGIELLGDLAATWTADRNHMAFAGRTDFVASRDAPHCIRECEQWHHDGEEAQDSNDPK